MSRASMKMNHLFEKATKHWKYISPIFIFPKNDTEYNVLVSRLDHLLDIIGDDENHQLIGLVDIISHIISSYDTKEIDIPMNGIDALKFLMELRHMNQADLYEIGSQGVISEILNKKRKLNLRQIKILSRIFNVNQMTFIDENKQEL